MHLPTQIAKHLNDVFCGGNWTSVNMREHLAGLTWQQATARIYDLNSIAALTFHINYFVEAQIDVLSGKPLNAHDKFSFDLPPIQSQNDWEDLLQRVWSNAEKCVELINQLPAESMGENFSDAKYGTWYRNLHGNIEHIHYHLGQIVVIKKILLLQNKFDQE
jgi:hypothetical protein